MNFPAMTRIATMATTAARATEPLRRIVVSLDASENSVVLLQTVVTWAAHWRAQLAGVFIEDVNLLHLSGFAFAREFSATFARERAITGEDIERRWRAHAAQARRTLQDAAGASGVESTFDVVRRSLESAIFSSAQHQDLIVMTDAATWRDANCVGCAVRRTVLSSPSSVLLAGSAQAASTAPVLCLFDHGVGRASALQLAAQIAEIEQRPLEVVLIGGEDICKKLEVEVAMMLVEFAPDYRITRMAQLDSAQLRHRACSLMVVPAQCCAMDEGALQKFARAITQLILVAK